MMKGAGLNNFQQRQLKATMQGGRSMPLNVHPTSSEVKVKKVYKAPSRKQQVRHWAARPAAKRGAEHIQARGLYDRQQFVPEPIGPSRDSQREYAADVAAYGTAFAQKKRALKRAAKEGKLVLSKDAAAAAAPRASRPQFSHDDLSFVQEEIADRSKFLQQLEHLGRGKSDDAKAIKAELATKNRMLEVIKREMASA